MVVIYDEQGMRMSYQLKKGSMQHLWQSVCGSVEDYDESSRHAAAREVLEETGLEVILEDLQYLFNDSEYDCDVYKLKVHPRTELDRTEPTKQVEWEHFSWDVYEKMVWDQRTTPTHATHYDQIITPTKPKRLQKAPEMKGAEEPTQILKRLRQEEPVAYTTELCNYQWWKLPEQVQWERFDPTGGDKVVPNHQEDNWQYWDNIAVEVEDRIAQEESWMDKEPPWRENPSEVPAGSYRKEWEIAKGYLHACEACGLENHHVHYRCNQCNQLVPQDYSYDLKWDMRCECRRGFWYWSHIDKNARYKWVPAIRVN